MPRHALVILALLQAAVFPAEAAEFIPSWDVDGVWDSNVLRDDTNAESDYSLRTGPTLRVREPQGDLVYDVSYQVLYQAYAQLNGINSFDQFGSAQGTWAITPNTSVEASDVFAYVSGLNSLVETTGNISIVTPESSRILSNNAQAGIRHRLGPLWEINASVTNQLYDYLDSNQADTTATTGTLQLTRSFSRRLIAGVGAQYQRQEFAAVEPAPASGTSFYQGYGLLNYDISPTWTISAQAGPAWAQPDPITEKNISVLQYFNVDPSTCPTNAAGTPVFIQFPQSPAELCQRSLYRGIFNGAVVGVLAPTSARSDVPFVGEQSGSGSLNYFGRITIAKDWRLWRATLAYSRSASNSSGLNTSTALDLLLGTLTWTPTRRWRFEFSASYSTQSSVNQVRQRGVLLRPQDDFQFVNGVPAVASFGVPFAVDTGAVIDNAIDVTSYRFELTGERRISQRLTIDGAASFWQQDTSGVLQNTQTRVIRVDVGFTWNFEAIPL